MLRRLVSCPQVAHPCQSNNKHKPDTSRFRTFPCLSFSIFFWSAFCSPQVCDPTQPHYDDGGVRHAETPELAREVLAESALLIFKAQVEVALREQTAGHNALLLFVHLALGLMEQQLVSGVEEADNSGSIRL